MDGQTAESTVRNVLSKYTSQTAGLGQNKGTLGIIGYIAVLAIYSMVTIAFTQLHWV